MNFKSEEENQFFAWLKEAEAESLVSGIEYEPESYELTGKQAIIVKKELKTKTKYVEKHLFRPHKYTPDFEFYIKHEPLFNLFVVDCNKAVVDVKGTWANRGGTQELSINRKLMYQKHGIYVAKVVPGKLFKRTWVPESCRLTPKQKKPVKKYAGLKNIREYMNGVR